MKKLIVNKDTILEYENSELRYSELDKEWCNKGEVAAKLVDNGDGFELVCEGSVVAVNYHDAHLFYVLLREKFGDYDTYFKAK